MAFEKADLKPYSTGEFVAQYDEPAGSAADPGGVAYIASYADYMDNQPQDSVEALTATGMKQVWVDFAKKTALSLDAILSGALAGFSPSKKLPPPVLAPRQGTLFDSKAYPPEHWFYQIEIKFRKFHQDGGEIIWDSWVPVSMHKGLHRSKVRALKVINGLMSLKSIYADPEYFQWRVKPIHYGMTYVQHVQRKLKHREKVAAIKEQARLEYLQNVRRALEFEQFEKEHQQMMKAQKLQMAPMVHQLDADVYKWKYDGPFVPSEGSVGNVLTVTASPHYGKSVVSLVPNPQGPPAIDVGKSPFKGWAVGLDCPTTGPDGYIKMYAVQKAKQAETDTASYAVQPVMVMHPFQYAAMLKEASGSSP